MSLPNAVVCRLRSVKAGPNGDIYGDYIQLPQRGIFATYGKYEFHNDNCLNERHVRVVFHESKPVVIVELLADVPAFYWRKGSTEPDKRLMLKPETPVELSEGDRFSLLQNLQVHEIEIGSISALNERCVNSTGVAPKPKPKYDFLQSVLGL